MNTTQLQTLLGTAVYESHGVYFKELINAGYDITTYYDGGRRWGDVSRVLTMVSYVRGLRSYAEYLKFYESIKQPNDGGVVTPRVYAKLTGITQIAKTQTVRTRNYRQRQSQELADLRESTALKWIDEHVEETKLYLLSKQSL